MRPVCSPKWLARLGCRDAALPRLDSRSHNGRFVHGHPRGWASIPDQECPGRPGLLEERGVAGPWAERPVSPITPFSSPRKAPRAGLRLERASQRTHPQWCTLPIGATVNLDPCLPVSQAGHASRGYIRWKVAGCVGRPRRELTHFAEVISASPLYSPRPISALYRGGGAGASRGISHPRFALRRIEACFVCCFLSRISDLACNSERGPHCLSDITGFGYV